MDHDRQPALLVLARALRMRSQFRQPAMDLYVSHSAQGVGGIKWFVVEPAPTVEAQVESLLAAGRTVYHIEAKPRLAKRLALKRPIRLKPAAPKRKKVTAREAAS